MKQSLTNQQTPNQEWLIEFARILKQNQNSNKILKIKTVFIESYLENIQEGLKPNEAFQKAKKIAQCFL